jgi:hypothetical protein
VYERAGRAADDVAVWVGAAGRHDARLRVLTLAMKEGREDGVLHAAVSVLGIGVDDGL